MGKALYRKYRPKLLADVIGQEHITTTLSNALTQGKISHAYLFTGPRGVGKTSVARILAYEVNGLPYDETATHLDIIEIDAASNRRIDEIRELREKVHAVPASAKYKVYIIDEVHMLTREAFNALLKTLEEPPAHAIFILATTEAHKVPATIISRTQRFTFRPIGIPEQIAHMQTIASKENIPIDEAALELIAMHSGGSFRDSISLLDQARSSAQQVDLATVQSILGIAPSEIIEQLVKLTQTGKAPEVLEYMKHLRQNGYQAAQLAIQLSAELRSQIVHGSPNVDITNLSSLLYKLLAVPASHDPMSLLELTLLEATLTRFSGSDTTHQPAVAVKTSMAGEPGIKQVVNSETVPPKAPPKIEPIVEKKSTGKPRKTDNAADVISKEDWQEVLQAIKAQHNTLYSIARIATPSFKENEITLGFDFPFHQKRFNESKTRQLVSDIIYKQTGQKILVTCVLNSKKTAQTTVEKPASTVPKDVLASISNIFGEAEVLE